jgi:hypothetical protein
VPRFRMRNCASGPRCVQLRGVIPKPFIAGLCLAALAAACAAPPQQAEPGKPASSTTVAAQPNRESGSGENPWARYGRLTLDLGGNLYYVYEQSGGEFSATVIERDSGSVKLRALNIPRAGVFYFPAEAAPCEAGPIQRLGLYSELVLYYLGRAFDRGPGRVEGASSAAVDGEIPELRFLEGSMKSRGGIHSEVRVSPATGGVMDYVVHGDKGEFRGKWEAGQGRAVVADGEPLDGWNACWYGAKTMSGGQLVFQPDIPDASSLKSFGDVRKAVGNLAPAKPAGSGG